MLNKSNPIGVMDSGIGGLTVVRELQRILPGEDIIYFGDSANCPYGNKTADQIFELSCHMLQFLGSNGVKCTAVACNTISTMAERLRPCFDFRIISIVEEAAKYVIREKLSSVGLIGTEFTVASGKYAELIHQGNPDCHVVGKGSPLLAALVDRGDFNQHDINLEITTQVDNILSREKVNDLILGCTHYPHRGGKLPRVLSAAAPHQPRARAGECRQGVPRRAECPEPAEEGHLHHLYQRRPAGVRQRRQASRSL